MHLSFVGHASVLVEHDGCGVLIDPWLVGDAFNESWAAYPQPVLRDDDLNRVTHLWISHEHPDHLSIPTLRSLPEERRRYITVLYQRHWSSEVACFLRRQGFAAVVELAHGQRRRLAPDLEVVLHQVGHEDASLALRSRERTILDLNDCKPTDTVLGRIARSVGPVDLLLDQFSIAGWPGNPSDVPRVQAAGAVVLAGLAAHVRVLEPRLVLPFASFVRFAHQENAFMNAAANTLDDVVALLGEERIVAMYPGDRWDLAQPWTASGDARARYRSDLAALGDQPLHTHEPKGFDEVLAAARQRHRELCALYPRPLLARVPAVTFAVIDLGRALSFDLSTPEVVEVATNHGDCVVEVSSQAAWYTFAFRWGLTTLLISGRLRIVGDESRFRRLKQLGALSSSGMSSRGAWRTLASPRGLDLVVRRCRNLWGDFVARAS